MSPHPPPQQISQESIEHSTPTSPAKQPTPKSTHRRQSSKQYVEYPNPKLCR
jgi:hypothetical protein